MPYKDPKKRKDYAKQYHRELRKIERDLIKKMRAMGYSTKVKTKRKRKATKKK